VPDGFPLLFLERLTYTDEGRPIDLEFVRFRGDRTSLAGWLHRTPDPTHPLLNHHPERG
jgi:GntR family transcriptional regulator